MMTEEIDFEKEKVRLEHEKQKLQQEKEVVKLRQEVEQMKRANVEPSIAGNLGKKWLKGAGVVGKALGKGMMRAGEGLSRADNASLGVGGTSKKKPKKLFGTQDNYSSNENAQK